MVVHTDSFRQSRWSLEDLFPAHDSPEMEAAFGKLEELVVEIEKQRDELKEEISQEKFMDTIQQLEEGSHQAFQVVAYASLWFSEDTQNQDAQTFLARVQQFFTGLQNRTLFFNLWWKSLDDETAERLMEDAGDYRYWLEEMRNFKPHTLSEAEEKVINIKDLTGWEALRRLYETITNRYTFRIEVEGQKKEMTRDELTTYVYHTDPDVRKAAYLELFRVYSNDGPILGQIYQSLVRDWRNENIDLRSFSSPIAVRNLDNDIPDEVVETLLDVCQQNAPVFHRYFRLKARWLGVDRLRRYDVYAPIAESEKEYDYETAVKMVLDSFERFDSEVAELALRVMAEDHLDSEIRKGKRSGAFCQTVVQDITPWVLVNYQGRARDVATLAHELGHAIHSMLASDHTLFTYHPTLPLAETASTFGELLLVDRLLEQEKDESVRRDILFRQVDDAYATILRQAYFALFEKEAHDLIHNGASVDHLAERYIENLRNQFGDSLELSDEFKWEWISIPHIYDRPFYVYAYAFGQLLVLSLYQQYKEEGESFKPRYLKILRAGGSDAPATILSEAGVDIADPSFWQGGFDVVAELVAKLETLALP